MPKINADEKLLELKIELPPPCKPAGNYRPALLVGNLLYVSGHTPDDAFPEKYKGKLGTGKVGSSVSHKAAYEAARDTGLAVLSTVKAAFGSLRRVRRLISATGAINSAPDFTAHPKIMDGFSDLMAEVFGPENGVGVRRVTGAASLPGDVPIEITECIFELE